MQRRAFNRIQSGLKAKFPCGNKVCSGRVTNLSENGMFICADIKFPFDSRFEVDISLKKKSIKVPVKVSRLVKRDDNYETIAVEVINPHKKYLEFITSLKSSRNSEMKSEEMDHDKQ